MTPLLTFHIKSTRCQHSCWYALSWSCLRFRWQILEDGCVGVWVIWGRDVCSVLLVDRITCVSHQNSVSRDTSTWWALNLSIRSRSNFLLTTLTVIVVETETWIDITYDVYQLLYNENKVIQQKATTFRLGKERCVRTQPRDTKESLTLETLNCCSSGCWSRGFLLFGVSWGVQYYEYMLTPAIAGWKSELLKTIFLVTDLT